MDREYMDRALAVIKEQDNRGLNFTLEIVGVSSMDDDWVQSMVRDNQWIWKEINKLVRKAMEEEMREIFRHNVYEKVDIQECWDNTGKEELTGREEERNAKDRKG